MTLELGRIVLDPTTSWSIAWLTDRAESVFFWSYIGPVMQEMSYQAVGQIGPRVSAIIGGLLASTILVGWLVARKTSPGIAFLLGLVFLLDPLFVQGYTMGRVDGWAIGLSLCACLILRNAINKPPVTGFINRPLLLAGAFAALAFFIWPSAIFIFPLIILEFFYLAKTYKVTDKKRAVLHITQFALGGLIMGVLILLPIATLLYTQFEKVIEGFTVNTRFGAKWGEKPEGLALFASSLEILRVLKFTPFLFLFGLLALIMRQQTGLLIACLFAAFLMLSTLVYLQRVQYLLPYFITSIAVFSQIEIANSKLRKLFKPLVIITLLIWPLSLSLGVRTALALDNESERDRHLVFDAARSMIGQGKHMVYIPYEFYYSGRSLGWQMYKPYLAFGDTLSTDALKKVLPHVDYVIMYEWEVQKSFDEQLKKDGLEDRGTFYIYKDATGKSDITKTTNISRIRNLYSIFRKPYGPYKLYVRRYSSTTSSQNRKLFYR